MTKSDFLSTILEQGFTADEIPDGFNQCGWSDLFLHHPEDGIDIVAIAYHDGHLFKGLPGKTYFLRLMVNDLEVFREVKEVANDEDFEKWFFDWSKERDGILSPEEAAENYEAFLGVFTDINPLPG